MRPFLITVALVACVNVAGQAPVFVEKELHGPAGPKGEVGPRVGELAPPLEALDQFGKTQTLRTISGPKGALIIFDLSADT